MRAPFMCAAALLLMSIGLAASADDTLSINYSLPADTEVTVNYSGPGGPINEQTWAVPFSAQLNGTGASFDVYCIDLTHGQYSGTTQTVAMSTVGPGSTASTSNPVVTAAELQQASWLIDTFGIVAPSNPNYDALQAGLQVAIWGVVSGDTITENNAIGTNQSPFYISDNGYTGYASIVTDADSDLNALGAAIAAGGGGGMGTLYALDPQGTLTDPTRGTDSGQNVLGGNGGTITTNGYPTTPEGSSLAMLGLGLAPLFGTFWFKRRNNTGSHSIA